MRPELKIVGRHVSVVPAGEYRETIVVYNPPASAQPPEANVWYAGVEITDHGDSVHGGDHPVFVTKSEEQRFPDGDRVFHVHVTRSPIRG